ncbi:hypothetical protein E2C01_086024 [Portunus trituberculatus]|uniref:Ig-like domain-containing protein n=1 Tax=Portunus trituberculatus TaxID=210409 RepID=A0A5B7JAF6_PORTR|nr:hypothetical protein [Portunus trituberculatus]
MMAQIITPSPPNVCSGTSDCDPPQVNATLGRSLKPRLLKEGDDVYFTCSVAANPPATSITWYHEVSSNRMDKYG